MKSFFKKIEDKSRAALHFPPKISREIFMRKELMLSRGTLRKTDYDDAWVFSCAAHADYVFDVGANVGLDALMISVLSNVKEVTLIDPNPEALALAGGNLIRNRLSEKARFVLAFAGEKNNETVKLCLVRREAATRGMR